MVEVRLPEQHFLDQEIRVDILVDTGDANYDFICNNIAPAWGGCDPDEAARRGQHLLAGGTAGVLHGARDGGSERGGNGEHVPEVADTGSGKRGEQHQCADVPLHHDAGAVDRGAGKLDAGKAYGALRIEKDAVCGLFDPWSGAGSTLDLELEHDVLLPMELVHEITPDVCLYRYGVDEVYGLVGKAGCGSGVRGGRILEQCRFLKFILKTRRH